MCLPIPQNPMKPCIHPLPRKSAAWSLLAKALFPSRLSAEVPALHWLVASVIACLFLFGTLSAHAQQVTVNPPEIAGPLSNPLMGFRPDQDKWSQNPAYPTIVRHYIKWNEIENLESDTVQKIRDFCNTKWANLPAANIKVIPRVYIDWDSNLGNEYWPSDLQTGDWSSPEFKARVVRLIGRLGEVWDNDPRVAWVQTGLIGYWGEQENPVGVDEDGWGQRLSDAFTTAFKNKKMIVRNMNHWPSARFGVYWDSYGHPSQSGVSNSIRNFNAQGRHLTEVVEGEVAYNWGETTFDPLYGGEPSITLDNAQYTDNMIDAIRELHCTGLGWISDYSLTGGNGSTPANVRANAARMQREFGYRFHLNEFSCNARVEPGSNVDVQFKVKNTGSAPFYEDWPVAIVIVDQTTRQLLWKATLPNIDVRTWRPGSNYSRTTRSYQTPPQEHLVTASIPLPANLPVGEHLIGVTILEPLSRTPGVFFAIPNFFKQSQTQPLCRIGVGMNASGHTLGGIMFDDLITDEARSYTLTPQGPSFTLTAQASTQGVISQPAANGLYRKDTGVEVRATGQLGLGFSSWGGALAGSTRNPAVVVMDADKSISANYVPVPTFHLSTASTNGAVILSPPGGIYNLGTEVTVTANPSSGYALGSWSGDLSGSSSSTSITMTADKSVTANFVVAPIIGPTSFNVNGGGPAHVYEGITFDADGVRNSGGQTAAYTAAITNRANGVLYQSERHGSSFNYSIPLTNGDYRVTLMFAENHFSSANSRIFNVSLEGIQVITGLDIFARVGKNTAYDEAHIVSVSDGNLNIAFAATTNNAKISAIQVERTQRPNSFTLATSSNNGSVVYTPYKTAYDPGEIVTFAVIPSSGYEFTSWSGNASGSAAQTTVTMDGNKTVTANFGLSTPVTPINKNVLLVIGNIATPGAADLAIRDRLQSQGYTVQLVGDSASVTGDAIGKALVILSSTVASGNVSTKFQTVAVPLINWETGLQDELSFTTVSNQGTEAGQTALNIVLASHPLAGGLPTGDSTVTTVASGFSWGEPGGSPIIIARTANASNRPCIYAYESGSAMTVGTAPARRVHLFLQNQTFSTLNEDGLKLFDAAVSWAINQDSAGAGKGSGSLDYAAWVGGHSVAGGPQEDDDHDGVTNYEEYVFGQHPRNGASVHPITVSLSPLGGIFSYTRRRTTMSGLNYSIWYSTSLEGGSWIRDITAVHGVPVVDGDVETVPVTVSSALLAHSKLFIRVKAD
jgi:Malectin domain/Domain of unknown function (DUF4832)/Divergent InlB B-repeat domain